MKNFIEKIIKWCSGDKALHFLWSYLLCTAFSPLGWYIGASGSLLAGICKEFWDSRKPNNKWCWWDLLADIIGIALGILVWYLIKH